MSNLQAGITVYADAGWQITSPSGQAVMTLLGSGNLVIFLNNDPFWASGTENLAGGPYALTLQHSGNLVVTGPNDSLVWQSNSSGGGADLKLSVNDAGAAQITAHDGSLWGTAGLSNQGTVFKLEVLDADGQVGFEADYAYTPTAGAAPGKVQKGNWQLKSQQWLNPAWKPQAPGKPAVSPRGDQGGSTALQVANLAWDFIKDSEPVTNVQGVTTSVLSPLDTTSIDYSNAITGQSETINIRGTVWPTNLTQFEVNVCFAGSYHASPPSGKNIPAGYYLPNLYVTVNSCSVYWPYSCSAHATVMQPVNTGSETNVDVQVDIQTDFYFTSIVDNLVSTIVFRAQGSTGFTIVSANI